MIKIIKKIEILIVLIEIKSKFNQLLTIENPKIKKIRINIKVNIVKYIS